MKAICRSCYQRLHPLGHGCPHILDESALCQSVSHELTDLRLTAERYFPGAS